MTARRLAAVSGTAAIPALRSHVRKGQTMLIYTLDM